MSTITPSQGYNESMNKLERLLRALSNVDVGTSPNLWEIQTQLLDVQVALADKIKATSTKREGVLHETRQIVKVREHGWRGQVQALQEVQRIVENEGSQLRHALAKSRSLGDAIAWKLLGGNTQVISSLSRNSKVGSVPDPDACVGVQIMAQHLARQGARFPILHDITNILRVGDITFISADRSPMTVEIKTHYVDSTDQANTHRYSVQVWGDEDQMRPLVEPGSPPPTEEILDGQDRLRRMLFNRRLRRQLHRMAIAQKSQRAGPDEVVRIDNENMLTVAWTPKQVWVNRS